MVQRVIDKVTSISPQPHVVKWSIPVLIAVLLFGLTYCQSSREIANEQKDTPEFLNLHDTVDYVGMNTCRECHGNVHKSFMKTGMGQSFDSASRAKSAASFGDHAVVYDSVLNFYYKPFWRGDSLFVKEYRLADGDTVHKRIEQIDFIVGSGQHTNSHIIERNNYFYQAPITFYTQKGVWDLAPGFEEGASSRFSRQIGQECMTCHNGLPDFEERSRNKFHSVKTGIDCERCHGPGELHVERKRAGKIIDTSQYADSTIVNPARLTKELQMSLCQRCHLQGNAVLKEGKSWEDFQPGMHLDSIMNVFLPEYKGQEDRFIMASQAERLRESACYTQSDMSCITCHNPHVSVEETSIATFNSKCQNCHNGAGKKSECTEDMATRNKEDDNCSGCHMPKSGSIDIPHVSITDHHIKTRHDKDQENISYTEAQKIQQFVGLKCMTKENPSSYEMAMGYLSFYEEFSKGRYLLDSAKIFIEQRPQGDLVPWLKPIVKYHFLRNDFASIRTYASRVRLDSVQDEWTNYRIGEAYFQAKQYQKALKYYQQAVNKKPFNLAFQNKLGSTYFQLGNYQKAERVFRLILTEDPRQKEAMANLGYLLLRKGRKERASDYFKKTLSLDPDYLQAMFNQAALTLQNKQWEKARTILQNILTKDPGNSKAQQLLQRLDAMERRS